MSESSQILLQHFKEKKSEKDSASLQEARRLVNLYRSLSCFGDDFVDQYNQMLLSVKPTVRRLLRNFMGGEEVEEYLQFLEQNVHLSKDEVEQKSVTDSAKKGYLPQPNEDMNNLSTSGKMTFSETEWQEMKMQRNALMGQTQDLLKRIEKLEHDLSASKKAVPSIRPSSFERYSEIIEDSGEKDHE